MRRLYRTTPDTRQVSLENRVDALERRYVIRQVCCELPTLTCIGTTDFTASDGAYYSLGQLIGADPSAFGVADTITVWADLGDGSGYFYINQEGGSAPGVVQTYTGPVSQGFADGPLLIGYDAGVVFSGPLTAGTAQLYLGQGVGGGPVSDRVAYAEANMMSYIRPVLHLSGILSANFSAFDPDIVGPGSPIYAPVLLVEGDDWDVASTWFTWTVLSWLDNDTAEIFTP